MNRKAGKPASSRAVAAKTAEKLIALDCPDEEWAAEVARREAEIDPTDRGAEIEFDPPRPQPQSRKLTLRGQGGPAEYVDGATALSRIVRTLPWCTPAQAPHRLLDALCDLQANVHATIEGARSPTPEQWASFYVDQLGGAFVGPGGAPVHRISNLKVANLALSVWLGARSMTAAWRSAEIQDGVTAPMSKAGDAAVSVARAEEITSAKVRSRGGRPSARDEIFRALDILAQENHRLRTMDSTKLAEMVAKRCGKIVGEKKWNERTVLHHIQVWRSSAPDQSRI